MAKILAVLSSGYKDEANNYETGWWGRNCLHLFMLWKKRDIRWIWLLH
ncbi:hypothetical protein [Terribacillus sp. DMT04]|nr:hypothetical protein [Terribacillus sp. DMT04]